MYALFLCPEAAHHPNQTMKGGITKHPNYKYLSDYDKKNTFDMEKHLRRRPALAV